MTEKKAKSTKNTKKAKSSGKKSRSLLRKILRIIKYMAIFFFASTIFVTILYKWVDPPLTPLMLIRKAEGYDINKRWKDLDQLSANLPLAALAAEDPNFPKHHGFDFGALQKAYEHNQKDEKRIKGGSTISQQTAKNVFLWPNRDYIRKGLEAYFTILIELIWGKERIMEVYLNIVETGPGIYGCEAASQFYFKKPSTKLSKPEAAAIICLLPCPLKYKVFNPSPKRMNHRNAVVQGMNFIGKADL